MMWKHNLVGTASQFLLLELDGIKLPASRTGRFTLLPMEYKTVSGPEPVFTLWGKEELNSSIENKTTTPGLPSS